MSNDCFDVILRGTLFGAETWRLAIGVMTEFSYNANFRTRQTFASSRRTCEFSTADDRGRSHPYRLVMRGNSDRPHGSRGGSDGATRRGHGQCERQELSEDHIWDLPVTVTSELVRIPREATIATPLSVVRSPRRFPIVENCLPSAVTLPSPSKSIRQRINRTRHFWKLLLFSQNVTGREHGNITKHVCASCISRYEWP